MGKIEHGIHITQAAEEGSTHLYMRSKESKLAIIRVEMVGGNSQKIKRIVSNDC